MLLVLRPSQRDLVLDRPAPGLAHHSLSLALKACFAFVGVRFGGDSWSLEKFEFMLTTAVDCSVEMPQSRRLIFLFYFFGSDGSGFRMVGLLVGWFVRSFFSSLVSSLVAWF